MRVDPSLRYPCRVKKNVIASREVNKVARRSNLVAVHSHCAMAMSLPRPSVAHTSPWASQ